MKPRWQSSKEKVLELITNSGSVGITQNEIHKSIKISKRQRHGATNSLKKQGKIYYNIGTGRFKLIEFQSRHEKESMEWTIG